MQTDTEATVNGSCQSESTRTETGYREALILSGLLELIHMFLTSLLDSGCLRPSLSEELCCCIRWGADP